MAQRVAQRRWLTRSAVQYARGAVRRGGAGAGVGGARCRGSGPGGAVGSLRRRGEAMLLPPPRAGRQGETPWCPLAANGREDLLKEWDDPAKAPHDVTRDEREGVVEVRKEDCGVPICPSGESHSWRRVPVVRGASADGHAQPRGVVRGERAG